MSQSDDLVDVRIIDFAHSTHRGLKDSTLHDGPDRGFIHGIQNFVEILNELKYRNPGNDAFSEEEEIDDKDGANWDCLKELALVNWPNLNQKVQDILFI